MKINQVIKQIRLNLGLSQTSFAEKLHVSFSTVNRWENAKVIPNKLATLAIISIAEENNIEVQLTEFLKNQNS